MTYVDTMIAPVPSDAKDAYLDHARKAAAVFREHGAARLVECWGDDLPPGETNSMLSAVLLKEGETVVASMIYWPSKAARDAGMAKVMEDARMSPEQNPMPFDGSRLIFGGFELLMDE